MSTYYSIKSLLSQDVIDIQWHSTAAGTHLVTAAATGVDSQYWEFVADPAGSGYFFIKSKAPAAFVIDILDASTASGTLLVVNTQKTTDTDSQLWQFFLDPSGSGFYMIMNKLTANVIDIAGDLSAPGSVLDSFPHTFPAGHNELWSVVDGSFPGIIDAVPAPPTTAGLTGNSNYIFNQQCNPFVNTSPDNNLCLLVTIDITQDIIWASGTGSTQGFSFQLNCYSAQFSFSAWQQYVIGLQGNNLIYDINCWPVSGTWLINLESPTLMSLPSNMIPAGYQLQIGLENDKQSGAIVTANFIVTYDGGKQGAHISQSLPAISGVNPEDMAPIVAFELNLVGPDNKEIVVLSQGAGIITYWVPYRMTAANVRPDCTETGDFTAERANSVYASLPANRNNIFKQRFMVQPD